MFLLHRVAFLLSLTAPLSLSAWAQSDAGGDPACPLPAPAFAAESFHNSVGINSEPFLGYIKEGPYAGAGVKSREKSTKHLLDLGIRHYRGHLKSDLTLPDQPDQMNGLYERHGLQLMALLDPRKVGKPDDFIGLLKQYKPGVVDLLEGPNEVNNKFIPQELNLRYKDKTDEAAGAAWTDDFYKVLKSDPVTRPIGLISYTAIFTDYRLAKPFTSFDYANMHSYQGYRVPSSSLLSNVAWFNTVYPVGAVIRPFIPTECGYNVTAEGGVEKEAQLRAQARRLPMLFAEYFRHGIQRAYMYSIGNGDGYGLMETDQETLRPSYFAMQGFLAAVKDGVWNPQKRVWDGDDFKAGRTLLFTMEGAPPTVHALLLQKRSGEYSLVIWNEVENYNYDTKREIATPPVPVKLRLQSAVNPRVTILTQSADGARYASSTAKMAGQTLDVLVPDAPMIVRIMPLPSADKIAPPIPESVTGTATENSARLSWKAPSGAKNVSGYFVFRNDRFIANVTGTEYRDKSAWLRPGLGYTYAVQAYDTAGNMSPRKNIVVQTAPRFPDPAIVSVGYEPANPKPGDTVTFKATVKNAGDGMLPSGVGLSGTFYVNGKYTTFASIDGASLAPGETRELRSGKVKLDVPADAKSVLLSCLLDDVNRIPNEGDKMNNRADASLLLDSKSAGMLAGSATAKPDTVNLSVEGTEDWVHFGLNGKDSVTRKAEGGRKISSLTVFGEGYLDATPGFPVRSSWTNGAPVAAQTETYSALWWNGVGKGVRFTAPADTGEQVLRLYVGGIEGARGKLTAKLSDGSAPEYVSTTFDGNRTGFDWAPSPGAFTAVYSLRYKASKPGQTLDVSWTLDQEPNRHRGQALLQAVTLSRLREGN
ncbi:MAG: hypothetical protein H8F28_27495 [Fibrella sp.]|nr:hypothetical protein [Armatimonadota bacterium]